MVWIILLKVFENISYVVSIHLPLKERKQASKQASEQLTP